MVAVAVMLSVGICSCKDDEKDNDTDSSEEWVDLGLPSGLLWAKCNLGALKPEQFGRYYAWGETETKGVYDWSTYKYCGGNNKILTKYCSNSSYGYRGFTDTLTVLQSSDDAAAVVLGEGARIPTYSDWNELRSNTTSIWTYENEVFGMRFTANNGKSIFLPAAGGQGDDGPFYAGSDGLYWTSFIVMDNPAAAWTFRFYMGSQYMDDFHRAYGFTIRAVRPARKH